jgi:hypothetical protein
MPYWHADVSMPASYRQQAAHSTPGLAPHSFTPSTSTFRSWAEREAGTCHPQLVAQMRVSKRAASSGKNGFTDRHLHALNGARGCDRSVRAVPPQPPDVAMTPGRGDHLEHWAAAVRRRLPQKPSHLCATSSGARPWCRTVCRISYSQTGAAGVSWAGIEAGVEAFGGHPNAEAVHPLAWPGGFRATPHRRRPDYRAV